MATLPPSAICGEMPQRARQQNQSPPFGGVMCSPPASSALECFPPLLLPVTLTTFALGSSSATLVARQRAHATIHPLSGSKSILCPLPASPGAAVDAPSRRRAAITVAGGGDARRSGKIQSLGRRLLQGRRRVPVRGPPEQDVGRFGSKRDRPRGRHCARPRGGGYPLGVAGISCLKLPAEPAAAAAEEDDQR